MIYVIAAALTGMLAQSPQLAARMSMLTTIATEQDRYGPEADHAAGQPSHRAADASGSHFSPCYRLRHGRDDIPNLTP